jgi:hypothetical protein
MEPQVSRSQRTVHLAADGSSRRDWFSGPHAAVIGGVRAVIGGVLAGTRP